MRELRKDPITQRWILISTDFSPEGPHDQACPFCPGSEDLTPKEIYRLNDNKNGDWSTRVIPNRYPFFRIEGELDPRPQGMFDVMNGIGAHEIVIDTPTHDDWADMPEAQLTKVFQTYQARLKDLRGDPRFKYIMVCKNHHITKDAVKHQHSHIMAYPFIPMRLEEELTGTREHYERKERCLYCDIISEEKKDGRRVIVETGKYIAFVPFFAKYSFEFWVLPKEHIHDFAADGQNLGELASIIKNVMARVKEHLKNPEWSLVIHHSPNSPHDERKYHWHFEVRPKIYEGLGFEWGSGFFVTYTSPEKSAATLRGTKYNNNNEK